LTVREVSLADRFHFVRETKAHAVEVLTFEGGPFAENTYLLVSASHGAATLVDPGFASTDALAYLTAHGLELHSVLLTHAHIDHVEGLPAVRERHDVPIRLHPDDRPLYEGAGAQASAFGIQLGVLPPVDYDLTHGQRIGIPGAALDVRFAPGHAPGHVIFYCEELGWAIAGDVVFRGSIGRTDLPGGDFQTLMASIRREVLSLPDDTVLYPGHGPQTTVRMERVGNPFLVPHYGGDLA